MYVAPLLKGLVIGFSIAAPVGPIGVLCIRRSITQGRCVGLLSGLGAATADALYGCVAAFGLTAVSDLLLGQRMWLGVLGGGFLCYLGAATFRASPAASALDADVNGPFAAYVSTVFLTLANPATILSFVAIFAAVGMGVGGDVGRALALVSGVFLGSAAWWLLLSTAAAALGANLGARTLATVNRVSGAVIGAFGIYALLSVWRAAA